MAQSMENMPTGSNRPKWYDGLTPFDWGTKKEWHPVRFFGLTYSDFRHEITTKNGKVYSDYCHAYDTVSDDFLPNPEKLCPYCECGCKGQKDFS